MPLGKIYFTVSVPLSIQLYKWYFWGHSYYINIPHSLLDQRWFPEAEKNLWTLNIDITFLMLNTMKIISVTNIPLPSPVGRFSPSQYKLLNVMSLNKRRFQSSKIVKKRGCKQEKIIKEYHWHFVMQLAQCCIWINQVGLFIQSYSLDKNKRNKMV